MGPLTGSRSTRHSRFPIIARPMTAPRLLPTFALACLAACGGDDRARPGIPPRHVILITVGGLRADHTSALLYPRETTALPFTAEQVAEGRALAIDDLADAGVLFAQAFAPTTDPRDALSAVLTGIHPPYSTGPHMISLSRSMKAEGLVTAGFVSWPEDRVWSPYLEEGLDHHARVTTDREAVIEAVKFIGEQDFGDGRGRFLWVHLDGPTFPFEPGVAPSILGERDHAALFTDPDHVPAAGGAAPTDADREHQIALYDGEVAQVNALVSYLLDLYRYLGATAGAWERTATVVVGTHGVALFDPEEGGRLGPATTLADPGLHVPLILRHPDSMTGRRILKTVVETSDVYSTLQEWFGLGAERDRSLLALTDSHVERDFARRPAIAFDGESGSARTAAWRLLLGPKDPPRLSPVEGLRQRPENLAGERPEVVERLAGALEALRLNMAMRENGRDWRR